MQGDYMKKYVNPFGLFEPVMVPDAMLRLTNITLASKVVYARLVKFAGPNGNCYPSQETLAESLGISKSGVRKALNQLEEEGFIEVIQGDRTRHMNNYYRFLDHPFLHPPDACCSDMPHSDTDQCHKVTQGCVTKEQRAVPQRDSSIKDKSKKDKNKKDNIPPLPPPSEDEVEEEEKSVSSTWRDYPSVYDYLMADKSRTLNEQDFVQIWNERSPTLDKNLRPTRRTLDKLREFSRDTELSMTALCDVLFAYYELLDDRNFPAKEEIYKLDVWLDDYDHVAQLVRKYRLMQAQKRSERKKLAWGNLAMPFQRAEDLRHRDRIPDFYEGDSMSFYRDPGMLPFPYFYLLEDERITDLSEVHDKFVAIEDYPEFEFLEEYIDKFKPNLTTRFHAILAEAKRRNDE